MAKFFWKEIREQNHKVSAKAEHWIYEQLDSNHCIELMTFYSMA